MIGVRRAKVLREIWLFKARTLLVVLAIAVGVGAFGMMSAGRTILERDMQNGFAITNPAHAVLSLAPFDDGLIKQVASFPDVEAAEGRRVLTARIAVDDDSWVTLDIQATNDWGASRISRLVAEPRTSSQPPKDTLLIERSTAQQFDLAVGQMARVQLWDGSEREFEIVGLVNDQAITPSNINTATAYAYTGVETLSALGEAGDYNRLYVHFRGDRATWPEIEPVATETVRAIENIGGVVHSVHIPRPGKPPLWDTMNGVLFILGAMGLLTLALSGFLIVNVMWAVVARQIPEIGVMKSLGSKPGQIAALYLAMVLIFGVLALVLAIPIALAGSYGLTTGMGSSLNVSVAGVGLPLATVGLLAATALLVPVLAALGPITAGARITIREAISGRPTGTAKQARSGASQRRVGSRVLEKLPTLLLLSVRNTFRRPVRVVLTLVTLSLAGAMFIAVLGVRQSLQQTAGDMQAETNYDVEINFDRPYPAADIVTTAYRTPGVAYAETWGVATVRRVFDQQRLGGSMLLIGLPPDTRMSLPSVINGRRFQNGDRGTLFVNADALELLQDVTVSQSLALQVGQKQEVLQLVGRSARGFVPIAYIPYADFERLVGAGGYAGRLVVQTNESSAEAQATTETALIKEFAAAGMQINRSSTTAANRRSIAANVDIIAIMLLSTVALVAVVGGLGLASTMGMNVLERTREIGVLRSLGAKTPAVRRVVMSEGVVLALVSALIGILASVPLGLWLASELGPRVLSHPLDFVFSWIGAALWIVIVVVIAIAASLAPAQSAARMTIRDTLAYDG